MVLVVELVVVEVVEVVGVLVVVDFVLVVELVVEEVADLLVLVVIQSEFFSSMQISISSLDLSSFNAVFSEVLQTPMTVPRISTPISKTSSSCCSVIL